MKIACFSTKSYDKEYLSKAIVAPHSIVFFEESLNPNTVGLLTGFDGICVFVNDKLDNNLLQQIASAGIKAIFLRCAGFNNVVISTATSLGIKVYRVPAYSPYAVAEHAVALVLTLNRKTHKAYNRVKEYNFSIERLHGFDVHGKTVGVIGTGTIGLVFAKIMLGFGCKVIAFDPTESDDAKQLGIQYVALEDVLKQADILSLHCPLNQHTRHMISTKEFSIMKHGAMLINTSRGALIDTKEAIEALKTGALGYLGIDVYEEEEKLFFHDFSESIISDDILMRLMTFPNVLITSHQAFFTHEALTQIAETTYQNMLDFTHGTSSTNQLL
ncbi:MAG TPA: 2-hydroxyacid dehydrogenase [Paludibacteraceae bacterium]|nr:2-hydroxyacid dehydrogenase [Paludibacteraceae bacterium]MBP8782061.1 2-hydroxyacid dehydrogenase [Paludibacteraceae bacterium]HNZ85455.1 2-hydroxyacid dehydrogenase [Paludibacteraceae bacterium]HOR39932.1 2-hydroxyacid dehydrogenase [Paludibacteraceae bacterium]